MKIIKIYATWCNSCRVIEEKMKNIEHTNVDVDSIEGEVLVEKYKVVQLPTLLFFNEDESFNKMIDDYDEIEKFIEDGI